MKRINYKVLADLGRKGYLVADMKPEHIIISETDALRIEEIGLPENGSDVYKRQLTFLNDLITRGNYSVIDYELLLRTTEHENEVKDSRRHHYLDDQRDRFKPTSLPGYLSSISILGVPYIYGHAESTGGHLWVVGRNARLFDYFLPERWRKTPSLNLSDNKDVFYTITKDNIHLVWATSRVGELPEEENGCSDTAGIRRYGINSPFEEFAIAHRLNELGIPTVYVRAIYMTGTEKIEPSADFRRYHSHREIIDPEGNPVLQEKHNYITIRGYYNGPDYSVAEQGPLYMPIDLSRAVYQGTIDEAASHDLLLKVKERLKQAGYDGSLLKRTDLLLAIDSSGKIMNNTYGEPEGIICNFELIWNISDSGLSIGIPSPE
jgi:hypothetical protein